MTKCQPKKGLIRNVVTESDSKLKSIQIKGFTTCLQVWINTTLNRKSTKDLIPFNFLEKYLTQQFKNINLKDYPKIFKLSLATRFSKENNQDLPENSDKSLSLFPRKIERRILCTLKTRKTKVSAFWSLMQCKTLAKKVPDGMIKDAYYKHSLILSKVTKTEPKILERIKELVLPYIDQVVKIFPNQKTSLPSNKAYFEWKRSDGGLYEALNGRIFLDESLEIIQPNEPRLEPSTIILSGKPGTGKSIIQSKLSKMISKYLKLDYEDSIYSRNSMMEHWDGYNNQPLVLIDDFLQFKGKVRDPSMEIMEFITLNSTVDYRLPMAHLDRKGQKFNSPLIVYSTNCEIPSNAIAEFTNSFEAVNRRFQQFEIIKLKGENKTKLFLVNNRFIDERQIPNIEIDKIFICEDINNITKYLFNYLISQWKLKSSFYKNSGLSDQNLFEQTIQISKDFENDVDKRSYLLFPEFPNKDPIAEAHAIPEPLKVRMITKGDPLTWALKPLQKALFKSLEIFPCMKPCFNPEYFDELKEIHSNYPCDQWVSGDYSSATDNLHQDIMTTILELLCEKLIDHPIINYIRWDMANHIVKYPEWTGIKDIIQTNGQLMGSLLSFPILCIANACTLKLDSGSLFDIKGLIHGDDLAFKCSQKEYEEWKDNASKIGFDLSIGKNYISNNFVSIDSQVYYFEKQHNVSKEEKLQTGKYNCLSRISESRGKTFNECWKRGFSKKLIIKYQIRKLEKTVENLDVSASYGGLGPFNGEVPVNIRDKLIYLGRREILKPRIIKQFNAENLLISVPTEFLKDDVSTYSENQINKIDIDSEKSEEEFVFNILRKMEKRHKNDDLSWLISYTPLETFSDKKFLIVNQSRFNYFQNLYEEDLTSQKINDIDKKYFDELKKINKINLTNFE